MTATREPERARARLRDLGIAIGSGVPGPFNAITDVPGVTVGHTTLIEGEGPLVVGQGPIRTGVTVILPHEGDVAREPLYAGAYRLNGNGEMTGLEWVRESGLLTSPIALTNTNSVGIVRDSLVAWEARGRTPTEVYWALPVVAETWDGRLNDINGFHVRPEHVYAALEGAAGGPVAEGAVGGGTGMVCHGFKGGIGTASRVVAITGGSYTLGVLVQANYGRRARLRLDGIPIGEAIPESLVPSPYGQEPLTPSPTSPSRPAGRPRGAPLPDVEGAGSIIVIVATDAPLLPHQLTRVAQRPALGLARVGSIAANDSGDLLLAFSTANREGRLTADFEDGGPATVQLAALSDEYIDLLFTAAIEATEEAVWNALVSADTMTGRDGITAYAIPHDLLVQAWRRWRG
ncbi:MAG: DmpA family aminopeptidase [Candidatus Limnocylindrales bacterium]